MGKQVANGLCFDKAYIYAFLPLFLSFNIALANMFSNKSHDVINLVISIFHDLKYYTHCENIVTKASRRAALIHNFFFTMAIFVRPLLEYGSCIWNCHLVKDVKLIERVQCTFTRQ